MRNGRLTASILQEVRNKMEDIVKHKIRKTTTLVNKTDSIRIAIFLKRFPCINY
jgi:hypothetical protein